MVARFWEIMPRPLVVEAIDSLLSQAKDLDQNNETKREIVLSTTRGNVSFNANYQYRLFQMLPILQQIDPERADSILREQQQVKAALQQYPNGLQSPDSLGDGQAHSDKPQIMSMSLIDPNATDAGTREARLQVQQELQTKVMQVESAAKDDGEKALEDALRLPVWASERHRSSPRAEALLEMARVTMKRQPNVSSHALEKLRQLLAELPGETTSWLVDKGDYLRWAAQVYRGLRDDDKALSALKQGFETADELEARDADPDDPNLALRTQWPSTLMRIQLFQAASEISPRAAEEMLQDTSDPDERIIQKVALGRSLLGSYTPPFDAVDWRKAGLQFAFEAPY
jgi:tetratricopeptide (TPR) repeat protein